MSENSDNSIRKDQPRPRSRLFVGMQLLLLAGALVGAVLLLQWLVGSLRPRAVTQLAEPAPIQQADKSTQVSIPTNTPILSEPGTKFSWLKAMQDAADITTGRWSPDSRFLAIVQVDASTDPNRDRVYSSFLFYDAKSGETCSSGEPILGRLEARGSSSWLPDDRLLVTIGRGVYLLSPCDLQAQEISDLFSESVQIGWSSKTNGRYVFLVGETNFWLYDSQEQTAFPLEAAKPGPNSNDYVFWSPSSQAVLISQAAEEADTGKALLWLVDPQNGQITEKIEVPVSSGGNAPFVDWMLDDSLVVYGGPNEDSLLVERRAGAAPKITPIQTGIFDLNLQPGEEKIAEGTAGDPINGTYHLMVAYQSPQGDSILLYHSEDGRVERLPYAFNTLLFFPNEELMTLNRMEYEPPYSSEFELIFVDDSGQSSRHLQVEGHQPRKYPQLIVAWDQYSQRLAFASNQGVSLISAQDGGLIDFWKLEGAEESDYVGLQQSPDGKVLLAEALVPESFMGPPPSLLYEVPVKSEE